MSSEHSPAQATPSIDSLRWEKFPVLDDGFVTLVDVMGDVTETPLLNAPRSVILSGVSGWPDRAVPSKPSI